MPIVRTVVALLIASLVFAAASPPSAAQQPRNAPAVGALASRQDRATPPPGFDPACPGGKVRGVLDCPEVVCPCQRGKNVVLARVFDPDTGCCNAPSCDELCSKRSRCPRFACPCGVPGDRAAATDEKTGECIRDEREVCRRACGNDAGKAVKEARK
jgi:hypothetical protein